MSRSDPQKKVITRTQGSDGSTSMHSAQALIERPEETDEDYVSFPSLPDPEQEHSMMLKSILSKTLRKVTGNAAHLMKNSARSISLDDTYHRQHLVEESPIRYPTLTTRVCSSGESIAHEMYPARKHNEAEEEYSMSLRDSGLGSDAPKGMCESESHTKDTSQDNSSVIEDKLDNDTTSAVKDLQNIVPPDVAKVSTDGKGIWLSSTRTSSPVPPLPVSKVSLSSLASVNAIASTDKSTLPPLSEQAILDNKAVVSLDHNNSQGGIKSEVKSLQTRISSIFNNLPNDIELSDDSEGDSDNEIDDADHADLTIENEGGGSQINRKDFGSNRKDDTIPDYSGDAEYKKRTESLKKNPRQVSNLSQALLDNAKSLINVGSTSYPSSIKLASNSKERKKRYSENPLKNGGILKRYWMNDSFVSDCTNCFKPFTAFRRKHHCRFCGQIFCSDCTLFISYNRHKQERKSHTKSVRFNDNDKLRVCKPCYSDVIVYLSDDSTETSSFSGNEDSINPGNDVHSSSVTLARTRTHSFNSCLECLNEGLISRNTNLTSPSANSQRPEDSFHSPTGINTPKGNVNIMKIRNNSKRAPKMAIPATRKGEAVEIPALKSLTNNINSSPHSSFLGSNVDINGKSWFKTYAALKNNNSLLPVKGSASADSTFKPLLRSSSSKYRLNGKSSSSYYASRNGDNVHGLGNNSENENEYEGDQDEPESETEDEQVMSLYASLNHKDHSGNEVNKSLSPRNQTSLTISGSVPTLGEFPAMKVGNTNFPKTYSYETYHVPFQKDGLNSVKDNDSYNFPHVSFLEDSSRGHNLRSHERAHASLMRMRTRRRSKPVRKLLILTQNNNRLLGLDSTVSSSFRGEHSPTESPTSQCSNRSASVLPQTLAASSNDVFSSSSFVHPSSSSPGLLTLGNSLSKDDILEKVPSRGDYVATDTEYEVTSPSKDFAIGYFDSELQSVKKEHFRIYTDHLNKIMDQCLRDGEINENVERWKCTLNQVLSYINKLKINDTLDIRQYIKVKRILGGQIEECDIIDGLFITKNVDSRKMCTRILNPKIALLMFPLEYLKQKEQFISLRIVYSQESVYIKNLVSRIVALKPDIIVVGDTVSGLAEKLLEEEKITVISNTKPQVIERISRYTKANIFQSINDLFFKNGSLGSCKSFEVKKFSFQNEVKSFVFFTGNDIESGFTICLRGGGEDVLNSIKFTTETLIPGVLNKRFEMGLLENQGLRIASSYDPADEAYNILRELEQSNKEKNKLSETISCLKEVIIENMELTSYVQNFRERVLSDSPIVKVSLPLALRNVILSFKSIVEEAKVYDEISQVKSIEEINPQWLERLRLSLDLEAFPNKFKDILEVLKITSKNSIFASIDNFQERSRTWSNSTKFPSYQLYPIFHRSIHFLHSTVSMKHATPCSGPNTIVINYYTDNDKCLGLFLDQLFQDAPKLCEECGDPYLKHYNTYVHGRGKIDIIIEEYSGIVCDQDNSTRNQRFMWSSCKKCNTTTPIAPLSDETYYLSIGKFFEIGFYGSDVTVWGTACDHDFFEFHVRYFTFNNMVIKMEYSNIDTYEVVVPKKQLEYTPNKDIELKVKTFNQVNLRTDKLFQSVLSRLNRINSQNFDNPTEIEKKLEEFRNRLFFERDSLKKKTLDIYNSTEATVHLCLNSVLRELQELGVLWDHDFNEFGRRFFPSENELTRMTQSHVKKFLLDKYNSENSAAEDITPSKAIEAELLSEPFDDKSLHDDIPNNEEAAEISGAANSTNPQSPLEVEKRNSDSKKPASSSVLEKVNKMEALIENDGNQSRKNDKDNASGDLNIFNNNSRRSSSNSVPQNKVTQLASFFNQMNLDQISLEFKKEREREFQKKVNKFKAMPVVASKPIVEIYNKIEDVVDVNDDNENDKDEHRSKSKLSLHNEQKPSIHDAERSIIEKTAQAKKESRTNDKEGSLLRDKQIDLPQPERNSLLKSLTNFWADRSTGLWEPLEYPLSSTEHTFADSDVIVREDEPSSLIAFCLSSSDYVQKLKSMASDTTDDDIDMSDPSNKKHKVFSKIEKKFKNNSGIESLNECERVMSKNRSNHLKYQFNDGETNLSCKIFYLEQFEAFRKACGNDKNFIQSLSRCVKWDSSGGKSGSNFLKTLDDRYIVKELSKSELESFVSMAPFYFKYIAQSIFHTLTTAIAKIFGFYQIQIKNNDTGKSVKMDLLIMENLFCNHKTTRIFDLKGSMRNRHVKQTGKENEVLLDENMIEYIYESPVFVKEHLKKLLRASLFNDTSFLSAMDVMDYSLIIGIDDSSGRLYVGIIDWLQTFTWDKKVENWVKGSNLIGGGKRGKDPTIITPKQYRIRFREAMERYILQVPDYWYEGK